MGVPMYRCKLFFIFVMATLGLNFFQLGSIAESSTSLTAQTEGNFRELAPIGQLGGQVYAVAAQGHRVVVAQGLKLIVYDITDPRHPAVLGQSLPFDVTIEDLLLDGDRLYGLSSNPDAILVFDWSRAVPMLIGETLLPGSPRLVRDSVLYITLDEGRELQFWDVSHPEQGFSRMGRWRGDASMRTYALEAVERRVYMLIDDARGFLPGSLVVLDINNPAKPEVIEASADIGYWGDSLWAQGIFLYGTNNGQLKIFQWREGKGLVSRGHVYTDGGQIVGAEKDRIYIANGNWEITVVDVSNPDQPVNLGKMSVAKSLDYAFTGHHLLGALGDRGWMIWDASDPAQPQLLVQTPALLAEPQDIAAQNGFVYIVDDSAFRVIDVRDPAHPAPIEQFLLTEDGSRRVFVMDHFAYVSEGRLLHIFDISEQSNPILIKTMENDWDIQDIDGEGDRIYLGGETVASLSATGEGDIHALEGVQGALIQVVTRNNRRLLYATFSPRSGFRVVDITDEAHPTLLTEQCILDSCEPRTWWAVIDLDIQADRLFLSTGHLYDITNPAQPEIDEIVQPAAGAVKVAGDKAFYAGDFLRIVDISQPDSPRLLAQSASPLYWPKQVAYRWHREYPFHPWGALAVEDNVVYGIGGNGLQIFSIPQKESAPLQREKQRTMNAAVSPSDAAFRITPPSDFNFQVLGRYGGHPWQGRTTLAVAENDYLFTAHGNALVVTDTMDPRQLHLLRVYADLPDDIASMSVHNGILAMQAGGLYLMDVHDPAHARFLAFLPGVGGNVYVAGKRVYALQPHIWRVFDISDPTHPVEIGRVMPPGDIADVAFQDMEVSLLQGHELSVYDFSNPGHLALRSHFNAPEWLHFSDIAVDGSYLAALGADHGGSGDPCGVGELYVFDISDPTHMTRYNYEYLYACWASEAYAGMVLNFPYIYVGRYHQSYEGPPSTPYFSFLKWDIRPDAPTRMAASSFATRLENKIFDMPEAIAVTDTRVVATYEDDLMVYSVDPFVRLPLRPYEDAYLGLPTPQRIGGIDATLFVSGRDHVFLLDNATLTQPQLMDGYQAQTMQAIFDDARMYAAYISPHEYAGILFDICAADMKQGLQASCIPVTSTENELIEQPIDASRGILLSSAYDHFYTSNKFIQLIDVRDVDQPQKLSSIIAYEHFLTRLTTLNGDEDDPIVALVEWKAPYLHDVLIAHARSPLAPLSYFTWSASQSLDIASVGDTLYILSDHKLTLMDISDPEHPQKIGAYTFPHAHGPAHALKIVDNRAYAAIGRQLWVVDMKEPAHPILGGLYTAESDIMEFAIQGSFITLAADNAGIINLNYLSALPYRIYHPTIQLMR